MSKKHLVNSILFIFVSSQNLWAYAQNLQNSTSAQGINQANLVNLGGLGSLKIHSPTMINTNNININANTSNFNHSINAQKQAAIAQLLNIMAIHKIADNFTQSAKKEASGNAVFVLEKALTENKTISAQKKQQLLVALNQNILPKVQASAIYPFTTAGFKQKYITEQAALYHQYYTNQDIEGLSNFFKTPIGQKFLQTQPTINKLSLQIIMDEYMTQAMQMAKNVSENEIEILYKQLNP